MSEIEPEEDLIARRRRLAAEISRQRSEFRQAYARLEQPIRYTEYGMRGFGFLRNNPWVIAAAPAAVSIIKTLWWGRSAKKETPRQKQTETVATPKKSRALHIVSRLAAQGWQLIQLYRQIRSYFP